MIKSRRNISKVILAFMLVALIAPTYAQTKTHLGVQPSAMLALGGAVGVGDETNLILQGSGDEDFTVPSGKVFVLTDIIFAPQVFPSTGTFIIQVLPTLESTGFSTALNLYASGENPSSFQVNLTGGMVFRSGSKVRVVLNAGDTPMSVNAFGYLVTKRGRKGRTDHD